MDICNNREFHELPKQELLVTVLEVHGSPYFYIDSIGVYILVTKYVLKTKNEKVFFNFLNEILSYL